MILAMEVRTGRMDWSSGNCNGWERRGACGQPGAGREVQERLRIENGIDSSSRAREPRVRDAPFIYAGGSAHTRSPMISEPWA
jgi:hypothetical protein